MKSLEEGGIVLYIACRIGLKALRLPFKPWSPLKLWSLLRALLVVLDRDGLRIFLSFG